MLIVVAALLLLLPLLAILQYRWLAELSERQQEHMKSTMSAKAALFSQDFDSELTRAYAAFYPSYDVERDEGLPAYAARYDRWLAETQYPRLVKHVLVAHGDEDGQLHLHQLKTGAGEFVPCDWPSELSALRLQLEQNLKVEPRAFGRDLSGRRLRPINDETMAFIYPILAPPAFAQRGRIALTLPTSFAIVTVSLLEIQQEILPALARRHFSGADSGTASGADEFDYSGAVVTQTPEQKVVYQFGPAPAGETEADVTVGLTGLRWEALRQTLGRFPPTVGGLFQRSMSRAAGGSDGARGPSLRDRAGPPFEEQKFWQLRLTHRAGSLEAAVAYIHRRNLMVSFSILALLAVSVALVLQLSRRAQRLARREMNFVAGVSHELRTPLAVIKSAAWNLTRGVIRDEEQIKRYSALIGKESDRLIEMVEQVLEFAGARSGRQKLELQPVSVSELIDGVLASSQPLLSEGDFQIEKEIAPDLPRVMADASALARALRNLIDNAMKYSGENRWIRVRAQATTAAAAEVRITVSDHGLGIPAQDLKYIFEPFWRGGEAATSQIHGNGLGLNLVKTIINEHGGAVSVESAPGRGTSFTLTLPGIARTDTQPAIVTSYLDTGATG
ncbi:MAG: sensor histidine kinase [Blastocatellia bacterium]